LRHPVVADHRDLDEVIEIVSDRLRPCSAYRREACAPHKSIVSTAPRWCGRWTEIRQSHRSAAPGCLHDPFRRRSGGVIHLLTGREGLRVLAVIHRAPISELYREHS